MLDIGSEDMGNSNRVSVQDAARELGMNPQGVREYMKRGLIDIGMVVPSVTGNGMRYIIMREKLNKVLGK
jgi:predicted transcriptional regulator